MHGAVILKLHCVQDTLNEYLELGRAVWGEVRKRLQAALHAYDPAAANAPQHGSIQMIPQVCSPAGLE